MIGLSEFERDPGGALYPANLATSADSLPAFLPPTVKGTQGINRIPKDDRRLPETQRHGADSSLVPVNSKRQPAKPAVF